MSTTFQRASAAQDAAASGYSLASGRSLAFAFAYVLALTLLIGADDVAGAQSRPRPVTPVPPAGPAANLVLRIEEPVDWSTTEAVGTRGLVANVRSSIRVTGNAKYPDGIQEVLLNKDRASTVELPDGSTQFVGYIRVEERMTSASVTVVTKNGQRIPVHYNISPTEPPPPDPKPEAAWDARSKEAGFKGKRWAVVIGISKYEDKEIPSLKYADADAKAFYDFLRSPLAGMGGFDEDNVRILLNENATYKAMRVALFDFLKNATADDVVYIYFAGHGSPDPQRRENMYLLPYDAKASSIGGTGFPMEDMNKALRQVTAAHKILITDACHSGGITSDGARAGITMNEINLAFLDRMSSSSGVNAMFTASGPSETSLEGEQWGGGHGVFTHYLLEGLTGAADADGDHIVDLQEMIDYASSAVERATVGSQHPMTGATAYDHSFPIAMVLPGVKINPISLEEIERAHRERSITDKADETPWIPADSALLVAGMPDTLEIRLQNPEKEVIPPAWLTWTTSNSTIATVDKNGVVLPLSGGNATITAARGARKVESLIHVLPRPSDVVFSPLENDLQLVLSESFKVRSDLLIGTNQWVRDMPPRLTLSDTFALRQQPGGEFVAYREGVARLTASIGGKTKEWNVRVIPPNVKVKGVPVTMALNDSVPLTALRVRPDGHVLGEATSVRWQSLDTTHAVIHGDRLVTRAIGRARLVARLGNAVDTVSTFVLGELLIGTDGDGGANVVTVSMDGGHPTPLLSKGMNGGEPALSPKGDRIAFVSNKRLYAMDADGSNVRRLTPDMRGALGRISSYEEHSPSWSSDGSRIVFVSNAPGNYEIMSVTADGKDVQRLTSDDAAERRVAAAPDIPLVAFERAVTFDMSEVILALPDGSQPQHLGAMQLSDRHFSQIKPQFLPGGKELIVVRRWPGRDGESLNIVGVDSTSATKEILHEERDHSVIFAVSPDGRYVAYYQNADWGKKNNSIVVVDRNGGIMRTITLGAGIDIKSLAWGASSIQARGGK